MTYEANSGLQVVNQYGPRDTGTSVGVESTTKSFNTLSVEITGKSLADPFVSPFVMPKGAKVLRAYVKVDMAFPGVTSVSVGEGDAPGTNGITLVVGQLGTAGVHAADSLLTGTWATSSATARASRLGMVVAGTPTGVGLATIVIEYLYKTRDDSNWKPDPDTFPDYPDQG